MVSVCRSTTSPDGVRPNTALLTEASGAAAGPRRTASMWVVNSAEPKMNATRSALDIAGRSYRYGGEPTSIQLGLHLTTAASIGKILR